jgi:hypothetical protein
MTGPTDDEPMAEAWAYLTRSDAQQLYQALAYYFEDGEHDPGWHHHVGESGGPQLTIAIET